LWRAPVSSTVTQAALESPARSTSRFSAKKPSWPAISRRTSCRLEMTMPNARNWSTEDGAQSASHRQRFDEGNLPRRPSGRRGRHGIVSCRLKSSRGSRADMHFSIRAIAQAAVSYSLYEGAIRSA